MKRLIRRLPTTDLYFAHVLPHVERISGQALPPVRQIARHCYKIGDVAVMSRYANRLELAFVKSLKPRRLVYLIDDDLQAGISDTSLSQSFRARLKRLQVGAWPHIVSAATDIIVPNERLAESYYGRAQVHLMHPVWHLPPASGAHFPPVLTGEIPFRIAFLGTHSHLADLEHIADVLRSTLQAHPNVRLHMRLGDTYPKALQSLDNVISETSVGWRSYKAWIGEQRFHLALYPLRRTDFNAARSTNKLIEHSVVGAASLFSPAEPIAALVGPELREVFVKDQPEDWFARLETLIHNPLLAQTLSQRTAIKLNGLDLPGKAAAIWREILNI